MEIFLLILYYKYKAAIYAFYEYTRACMYIFYWNYNLLKFKDA